jgi:hypothetical protein
MEKIDYSVLPDYMREAAQEYVEHGYEPYHHDFFYELLTNDLFGVYRWGDETNIANLQVWMKWLYNEVPHPCWGSVEKVAAWVAKGGMVGPIINYAIGGGGCGDF